MAFGNKFVWVTVGALAGVTAFLVSKNGAQRAESDESRRNAEVPVEELAEELKEAWAEHHTHA